jgi:hypothetical protein
LIKKYRGRGALFDANLLVLLLVGAVNKQRILNFKRLDSFSVEDFDLLARLIAWFGKLYSTPHVLSQASDLTALKGRELGLIREKFKLVVDQIDEYRDPSQELVADTIFERFGLADAAIAKVNSRRILVVTADVRLHVALQQRGWDALNFNHVRPLAWH